MPGNVRFETRCVEGQRACELYRDRPDFAVVERIGNDKQAARRDRGRQQPPVSVDDVSGPAGNCLNEGLLPLGTSGKLGARYHLKLDEPSCQSNPGARQRCNHHRPPPTNAALI
jgi:hypothetical protein